MSYYEDYPGSCGMRYHDKEPELRRWFDNYKLDHAALFPWTFQWLTIEEKSFETRRRRHVRYEGTIGDDSMPLSRSKVLFETDAPPPPTFYRPAKPLPAPVAEPILSTALTREYLRRGEERYEWMREMIVMRLSGRDPLMRRRPTSLYNNYFYSPPPYSPPQMVEVQAPPPRYRRNNE